MATRDPFVVPDGGTIRLLVRRRLPPSDPAAGYELIKVQKSATARGQRLSEFDAAAMFRRKAGR